MEISKIQTGDLLHCQGNGIIAKGIRLFTGSKTTHTAVAIWIWGRLYIIDAQRQGVFPRTFETWMLEYEYKFEVSRNPNLKDLEAFSKRAMSKSGSRYDKKLLLIEQPSEIIKDKFNINSNVSEKFKREDKFVCSEYAMWCHSIPKSYEFTPQMVVDYCKENNWVSIVKNY